VSIVGTAASGAPLAGAAVSLKCAGTSLVASADANGSYRIDSVPVDAAPCLLRAQQASTVYIAPITEPGTGTITVNATPLTHLLSSRLLGEPADRAFQNVGAETFALVNPAGISAARGHVRAQIDRLGITVPGLSSDWIGTPFQARAGDAHDDFLEALGTALTSYGLTISTAAAQLASSDPVLPLPPKDPEQACTPRLIDGFAGADRNRWISVGSGAGQTQGIGIGGGPGFTSGASVEVTFANGTVLTGARTDADKGMVTLVPCGLTDALPARIRMSGGAGATYYDPGRGSWASFGAGRDLHSMVNAFEVDANLAVTPFTEAVYRRVLTLGARDVRPWQDAGRIEVAHDEVRSVVNDLLPGMFRLDRLDRMPVLIDHRVALDRTQTLPQSQAGVHGVAIAALARVSAENRPVDMEPALEVTERFAADMADGVLDNPYAGLDPFQIGSTSPAYDVGLFWERMASASIAIGRDAGVPALWSGKPFPLALLRPSGHRDGVSWPEQYIGLYSDGMMRSVIEVGRDLSHEACGSWCNPVRKVSASANTEWWVFELGQMAEFDPVTRIGLSADGGLWTVGNLGYGQDRGPLWPRDAGQPAWPISRPAFEIGPEGKVYRLIYPAESQGDGASSAPPEHREELPLPARARQLSSDGRLHYVLLSNGQVYVLNPEIIVSESEFVPIDGMSEWESRYHYWGQFRSAGYPEGVPLRVDTLQRICRIGGTYLQACDGQLYVIDRVYHWLLLDISWNSMRAPDKDYVVRPASGLDAKGWRAFKAPLSVDIAWDDSILRLLSRTDGSYVLESDTWGIRDVGTSPGQLPQRHRITQQVVESWLGN
jgi:hypothetical protein